MLLQAIRKEKPPLRASDEAAPYRGEIIARRSVKIRQIARDGVMSQRVAATNTEADFSIPDVGAPSSGVGKFARDDEIIVRPILGCAIKIDDEVIREIGRIEFSRDRLVVC